MPDAASVVRLSLDDVQERCRLGYVKDPYFLDKLNTDVLKSTVNGLLVTTVIVLQFLMWKV